MEREPNSEPAANLPPGSIETEFGVPLAGVILPPERWAKTALKHLPESGLLDFAALFGRSAPRVLDIGCGNGRFIIASAVRRPEIDHIGIDSLPMVIRYATRRANQRGLTNCRLAVCDGDRFLSEYCPPGQLAEIHVYHPQPYPLPGDYHLRLFSHEFLGLVHRALANEGRLVVQTDNAGYWEYLQRVLGELMHFHVQDGVWPDDPLGRSRREIVALNKGLTVYRGWGQRRDDLDAAEFARLCATLPEPNFRAAHNRNPRGWRRPGGKRRGR